MTTDREEQIEAIVADRDELKVLLQWQQQQYHQIQSLSHALLGSLLTIAVISITIIFSTDIIYIPTSADTPSAQTVVENSFLGFGGIAVVYLSNVILFFVVSLLTILFGVYALLKLLNLFSSPQLYPRLENMAILPSNNDNIDSLLNITTANKELISSVNKNINIIQYFREQFYGAFLRSVFFIGFCLTTYQIFIGIVTVDIGRLLWFNIILVAPTTVFRYLLQWFTNPDRLPKEDRALTPLINEDDSGRFPLSGEPFEAGLSTAMLILSILALLAAALDGVYVLLS